MHAESTTAEAGAVNLTGIRIGAALGLGFGIGSALAAKALMGADLPWSATMYLGLGVPAGFIVGFPIGCQVGRWLGARMTRSSTPWAFLGLVGGSLFATAMVGWLILLFEYGGSAVGLGTAALGLWIALVFGSGFGHRL